MTTSVRRRRVRLTAMPVAAPDAHLVETRKSKRILTMEEFT